MRKNEGKDGDRKGGRREGLRDWYPTLIGRGNYHWNMGYTIIENHYSN